MNNELIEKLKACKTAEEVVAVAKENGAEIALEEAAAFLAKLNGQLSDDELDDVAAGGNLSMIAQAFWRRYQKEHASSSSDSEEYCKVDPDPPYFIAEE